jgi:hypothetical protein
MSTARVEVPSARPSSDVCQRFLGQLTSATPANMTAHADQLVGA